MTAECWSASRVVLLGAAGMLGSELAASLRRRLGDDAKARLRTFDQSELDITDRDAVARAIQGIRPGVVINAAAYTDVERCESEVKLATSVNVAGARNVAQACRDAAATLVHFSTDYVFDGRAQQPYRCDDTANPLNVYGRSKWEGEQAVRAVGCRHLLVRSSWLYGAAGRNFVEAILAEVESGRPLRVVDDQIGRPTFAKDLSEAVLRLLDTRVEGAVHFANSEHCSWFQFAEEIMRQARLNVLVEPISSDQLDRRAVRPAYSVLDLSRYTQQTGQTPPRWRDALGRYLLERSR